MEAASVNSLYWTPVYTEEMYKIIGELQDHKASGYDNINSEILKASVVCRNE